MTSYIQHNATRVPRACPFALCPRVSACRHRSLVPHATPIFTAGHIFWDLDNLRPYSLAELTHLTSLISAAFIDFIPAAAPPLGLTAFANPTTAASLGGPKTLEKAVKGKLILTTARKQSVDLEMKGAMVAMVERNRLIDQTSSSNRLIVACVTDDKDFVGVLRYCGSLGSATVAVGRHGSGRRPAWAAPRRLDSLALPSAAAAAIALRKPAAPGEAWTVEQRWVNPAAPSSGLVLPQ